MKPIAAWFAVWLTVVLVIAFLLFDEHGFRADRAVWFAYGFAITTLSHLLFRRRPR